MKCTGNISDDMSPYWQYSRANFTFLAPSHDSKSSRFQWKGTIKCLGVILLLSLKFASSISPPNQSVPSLSVYTLNGILMLCSSFFFFFFLSPDSQNNECFKKDCMVLILLGYCFPLNIKMSSNLEYSGYKCFGEINISHSRIIPVTR